MSKYGGFDYSRPPYFVKYCIKMNRNDKNVIVC